jgi:putative transcriptional regulator
LREKHKNVLTLRKARNILKSNKRETRKGGGKVRLHERVRQLRKERGITQTHMAKKLGYKSVSSYHAFETGRKSRGISIEQARIIAKELNVTLEELFYGVDLRETRKNGEDDDETLTA